MELSVIFDMDGVIVDNDRYHKMAWEEFCKSHRISFSDEKFRTVFFGRTNNEVLPDLFNRKLSDGETETFGREKEMIYRDIYGPVLTAAPGFISFLSELKSESIPVGVATSAPKENVDFVLQGLGIVDYFDVIVDDSMVSEGKPHPGIYLTTASLLNTKPEKCVVFEDSLSGTRAAWDAGARVVAVTTTLPAEEHLYAHLVINDFREISLNRLKWLLKNSEGKR